MIGRRWSVPAYVFLSEASASLRYFVYSRRSPSVHVAGERALASVHTDVRRSTVYVYFPLSDQLKVRETGVDCSSGPSF